MQVLNRSAVLLYKAHRDIIPGLILVISTTTFTYLIYEYHSGESSDFNIVKILRYVCTTGIASVLAR